MKKYLIVIMQVIVFIILFILATASYAVQHSLSWKHIQFTNTGYGVEYDPKAYQNNPDYLILDHYAFTIWCEARGDGYRGMLMVADVIKNRVASKLFPNSYYDVIHQKNTKKNTAGQFSCWKGKGVYANEVDDSHAIDENKITLRDRKAYQLAVKIAFDKMMNTNKYPRMTIALWYHTKTIKPYWAKHYEKIGVIGSHVLYIANKL